MLNRLEVKHLITLDALVREQNVSRVADQLGLTQQAVSVQLRKLREVFNDALFIRKSNGVVPTPRCLTLAPQVRRVLGDFAALTQPEIFSPATVSTTFTVSAMDYSQRVVLTRHIAALRSEAPNLILKIVPLDTELMLQNLATGALDLVISVPSFIPETLPSQVLLQDEYCCVADARADFGAAPLSQEVLAGMPQLVVSAGRENMRGSADVWFAEAGLTRNTVISVSDYSSVAEYLRGTRLIAFMPARLLPNPHLQVLNTEVLPPGFSQLMCWHARSNQDPLHRWLRTKLAAYNA